MALFSERRIAASAAIIDPKDVKGLKALDAARQKWQPEAWKIYDMLGEVHYPANWLGNTLSRFTFPVKQRSIDENKVIFKEVTNDPDVQQAIEDLENGDGSSELARLFAINWTTAADCFLVGTGSPIEWKLYSTEEVEFHGDQLHDKIKVGGEPLPPNSFIRRIWRSHAGKRIQADGALRALHATCMQLVSLNASITAQVESRLASAGLLFIPNTIQIPGAVSKPDGTKQGPVDPLIDTLMDIFTTAMINKDSAAGKVPIFLRGPEQAGQWIKHIVLDRLLNEQEMKLRAELRATIFQGLDLPPEIAGQVGDLSHWRSWSVMDQSFQNHVQPMGAAWAYALSTIYLQPYLKAAERKDFADFWFAADGAAVVTRPNDAEDRRQLHDRGALSAAALRESANIPDEDAMSDEEYVRWVGVQLQDPYLSTYGLEVAGKIDWTKVGPKQAPGPNADPGKERPKVGNSTTTAGRPGGGAGGTAGGIKGKSRTAEIEPMFQVAYRAGFLTIGARLRAHANRVSPDARLKGVPNEQVHIKLGGTDLEIARQAVRGVFEPLLAGIAEGEPIQRLELLAAADVVQGRVPRLTFEQLEVMMGDDKEFANA